MRNFDENNITRAVLERLQNSVSPRTRQISEAVVRHLHALIQEIEPSQQEWLAAIEFLTATGQMCSDTRQEFILLSDTLGASMLVDAINHRHPGEATQTTVLGPFYVENAKQHALGDMISHDADGAPLLVEGSVAALDGTPIAGAVVDVWHSDSDGYYDVQRQDGLQHLSDRARFVTDSDGRFWFRSIVPAFYPIPNDGPVGKMLDAQGRHPYRPAHVHFMISAPGCDTLVTHLFLADDPYLDSDVVFGVKDALICKLEAQAAGITARGNAIAAATAALRYDFRLAPA
ncbi:intradiol ring-cleavage dioxygenase [Herbaspirillum rhizosphaerae]|uniref:Intradiol ring-cleavage dioxygenase n=1 Tax=Herbaspirillum rhizosphaerae TaxID=346179 RepID=A0ABW8Z9D7_9BURK